MAARRSITIDNGSSLSNSTTAAGPLRKEQLSSQLAAEALAAAGMVNRLAAAQHALGTTIASGAWLKT